ncbi:YceI family protein [Maricaulis sp. D1M11]|uniref:YceI family protein n=1 Tax=Maricaulis sp. D1M11 TaxID=3076117 RepID=UPI0039B3DFB0
MLRKLSLAVLVTPALALPVFAQDWVVDQAASQVGFETEAFGQTVEGRFPDFSAEITLDPSDLSAARINAIVDTATGSTGGGDIEQNMLSSDGLAPETYPHARFVSEDIRATDAGYEAHGELTIKDVTRPFILPFTLEIENGRAIAEAEAELARADYNVASSSWGDVAATLTLHLHIEADAAAD